jgi:hypothetical protein
MKLLLLPALLLFGWAASAQTTGNNNNSSDTTHHHMMRHRWGNGMGGDSLAKRDGFHRGGPGGPGGFHGGPGGGQQGWAYHRPGQERWGQGRGGHGRHGQGRGHFGRSGHRGWGERGMAVRYTPEQRKQIMTINKDYKQKSEDLFKQDNITLKQYKAGLIALQKEKKGKLQSLLTPQQNNEIAARRKRMAENAQVMEVARLERLKLHLSLSDDQVAKIKAGQENLRSQFKAIHENDNLLPQEKRDQMKTLMAKRNDTYKAVLTPDQYTQFEQMSHHRGGGPGGPMGHRQGYGDNRPGFEDNGI